MVWQTRYCSIADMLDFVFLEYSFDPEILDAEIVFKSLSQLGFVLRSEHVDHTASFWNQNQCILLVHERSGSGHRPGITGLGFMGLDNTMIDKLDASYEASTGTYVVQDPQGFRSLIIPAEITANAGGIIRYSLVSSSFEKSYVTLDSGNYSYPGLDHISGITYPLAKSDSDTLEYYQTLGFRMAKHTDKYQQMLSGNSRFSLLLNHTYTERRTAVLCESQDVFWTAACYAATGVNMITEIVNPDDLNFGSLNHRICGYNCVAQGTEQSYSIGKRAPEALPGLDLLFRTSKKFFAIPEPLLEPASA